MLGFSLMVATACMGTRCSGRIFVVDAADRRGYLVRSSINEEDCQSACLQIMLLCD